MVKKSVCLNGSSKVIKKNCVAAIVAFVFLYDICWLAGITGCAGGSGRVMTLG